VPGTGDGDAFDPTVGQWATLMRTRIVERVEHAADIEQGDFAAVDNDGRGGPRRDIGNLRDGNEFDGHFDDFFREGKTDALLRDYRNWLNSELQLLGNASHHAYSFGQANMAKRAIDEFDKELAATLYVGIDKIEARRALTELDLLAQRDTSLTPGLTRLRETLQAAIVEAELPSNEAPPKEAGPLPDSRIAPADQAEPPS
jgi:hypothetical protein